jgi:cell division protein FtsB
MDWVTIISLIFGFIGGGAGLVGVFTLNSQKKKAEAEANQAQEDVNKTKSDVKTAELDQVQEAITIWRGIAEDMKTERDEYKAAFLEVSAHNTKMAEQLESIRKELAKLTTINNKMVKLLDKITPDNLNEMVDKIKKCHETE